ncbi:MULTISPECIES: copper-binding protein [Noviherbaspirillum]|jgi:Cu/Ag efflux protein CusF|uniref:copper-binding protein n=1 Tax=Noviherbaspirillum TaxID=1344552 RepID=UPI00178C4AFD|nr:MULTISPECIES: copper-binding protein [Noviherbaspirillum]
MNSSKYKFALVAAMAALALNASADQGKGGMSDMGGMKMDNMGNQSTKTTKRTFGDNEAEVKAVDKAKKSITLNHGPIKSKTVEMPPMTMAFTVSDTAMLSNVKAGDKVKFTIENVDNAPMVTSLTVQK